MTTDALVVVPANEAPWEDLQAVLGERGEAHRCQCQWFRATAAEWKSLGFQERAGRLREQTRCGEPGAATTSGLVAYLDGTPVGWCAVEPRPAYRHLRSMRVPWAGRDEDPDDDGVWAVVCFVTRTGYRRRGVSAALAAAAVEHARSRGARAVEGYPLELAPGTTSAWGELYVGARSVFLDAGFRELSRPSKRRSVMRIDF
ncbi:GNAT family N-acetyltransferase [Isoptericola variabilis]|uniref:GCN5-related N-acetyltransferase n=1 Tax=Isoptericola variabilis (strain 225) TaxID=743718 RepID=F6FW91_ISOV2|nr:GNAT family N-acetyltransferase [Isoptericola variabilis]AEG45635.1 GCN5-related N-acetyltransferase [Isoptericola variabilis 225]TWH25756.1 acetyltransferase (GNAT) family protein [Isoptericola variabilis J7]